MHPTVYGYPAAFVLRDDTGEFEVATPFKFHETTGNVSVDLDRVADAIDNRALGNRIGQPVFCIGRPVY